MNAQRRRRLRPRSGAGRSWVPGLLGDLAEVVAPALRSRAYSILPAGWATGRSAWRPGASALALAVLIWPQCDGLIRPTPKARRVVVGDREGRKWRVEGGVVRGDTWRRAAGWSVDPALRRASRASSDCAAGLGKLALAVADVIGQPLIRTGVFVEWSEARESWWTVPACGSRWTRCTGCGLLIDALALTATSRSCR